MTFDEAKQILQNMRSAKRRANAIKARIADLESDADSIRSSLAGDGTHGGEIQSRVEQLAIKIETERERHIEALEAYFALEDRLADAIEMLEPLEQDLIIGRYMDGKTNWEIASEIGYSERSVKYKIKRAIQKIADNL